jgi:RimJ/RimL family protein N-acetyltransferase
MFGPLQTRRLLLRPLELSDAEATQRLFPHWEIVCFMTAQIPWPYPPDGALLFFRDVALPGIARGEEWHWTLRLKEAPEEMIGAIGLSRKGNQNRGFWLAPPWQGRGLMTEAVEAVTDYWFRVLGFPVLRAAKAVANVASRRISQTSGMRIMATYESDYVSGRLPTELWEMTAEEWFARHP